MMTNITLFGCGAIGSQLALHLASDELIFSLVDDDRVDEDNILTSAFLAQQVGVFKATALANLLWRKAACISKLCESELTERNYSGFTHDADLAIDCFDNVDARRITTRHAVPTLHVGVSRNGTGSITWDDHFQIFDGAPRGEDTFCTHLAGRGIIRLTACVAANIVEHWLADGSKESVVVTERLAILK